MGVGAARRRLSPTAGPPLAAAAAGLLVVLLAPPTADMAAHAYRTGLLERAGPVVWNAQWYGGHHVPGYSLLFSPVAALTGPRLAGALAGVVAVVLFGRLVRGRPGGVAAAWLFASAIAANVVIGRMPFTLGIALAVGAWACADAGRRGGAAALALGAAWASPVAGAFLAMAAAGRALGGGRAGLAPAAVLAVPALAGGALLAALFPEGGDDRFVATAFWPMLAVSVAAVALIDPARRAILAAGVLSVLVLVAAFAVPSPFGQNALRFAVVLGPPALVLAARPGAPRAAVAVVGAALVYLGWLPAVRAVAEAGRDPATARDFQAEARRVLAPRLRPGERVEVPLTLGHAEAARLAPALPLARGWQRQLDIKVNGLFYDGRALTPGRYEAWLRERGIRWVALPAAPLDFSAQAEGRLLRAGRIEALEPVHASRRWRIWRLRGPVAGARLAAAGPAGFALAPRRPGTVVTRERWTRYWTVVRGDACLRRAGEWTAIEVRSPGPVVVRARFSPARAIGNGKRCG